tara:strand:- start:2658 stop:2873 length:216 start_codon:yes stop_codon:yes gene_type:complete
MIDKTVAKEATFDVGIGFALSFPVAFTVLTFTTAADLSVTTTAMVQTGVFTFIALLRKYYVRLFFKKNDRK